MQKPVFFLPARRNDYWFRQSQTFDIDKWLCSVERPPCHSECSEESRCFRAIKRFFTSLRSVQN